MYSEALAIMDRNTIQLTLEAELSETKEQLADTKEQLDNTKEQLDNTKEQLSDSQSLNAKQAAEIAEKDRLIASQLAELERVNAELAKIKNK